MSRQRFLLLGIGLLVPVLAGAQARAPVPADATALRQQSLAANCAGCHGTNGRPPPGSKIAALAGMPQAAFVARMLAFKRGAQPSTVMQQLAKGYDKAQIESLGAFFASQPTQAPP